MSEVEKLLEKQAQWQKSRASLSWPEKIRMAEQIRPSVERWRLMAGKGTVVPDNPRSDQA